MRKVVVYELVSLDGVAQSPDEWVFDVDQEVDDDLLAATATQDAVLLGRQTYNEWSNYWPTAAEFAPFAHFINHAKTRLHIQTAEAAMDQFNCG